VTDTGPGFVRSNRFLLAALALPVVVVVFFLLASAVPRWLVAPPAYDLVLRVGRPYTQPAPRTAVEFDVRDGRLEATVRSVPRDRYEQPWSLILFEHETMNVREIRLDLPEVREGGSPQTIAIDPFGGRRILPQAKAPDGYELKTGRTSGPGLVGDLFGMGRYDATAALVNKGRVVTIPLPQGYQYLSPVHAVGWLADAGAGAR